MMINISSSSMIHPTHSEVSEIEISLIHGKSKVTTSKIYKPLKIFPLYNEDVCQIVFSNYGGGFVEGDEIMINLTLAPFSKTVFTNQANTRIYKSVNQLSSKHQLQGMLGDGALAVYLGDPVIAHQGSIFEQISHWKIKEKSVLLIVDWFEAGRLLNEERFEFESFYTEMKIEVDEELIVWDKFKIKPETHNPDSPGAFLDHSCYLNIFLIGNDQSEKVILLEKHLKLIAEKYFHEENPQLIKKAGMIGALVKISNHALLIRCSAKSHDMVANLVKDLSQILSNPTLLGFNPIERKF